MTDLYRYFNDKDELLYVGISKSAVARAIQHQQQAEWWEEFSYMTRERFVIRGDAENAERIAIQNENPKYNIVHKVEQTNKKSKPKYNEDTMCNLVSWEIVKPGVVRFDFPKCECCNMTSTIGLAKKIMPDVVQVQTFAGGKQDTFYNKKNGFWTSYRPGFRGPQVEDKCCITKHEDRKKPWRFASRRLDVSTPP